MITHFKLFSTPTSLKMIRSTIAEKSYVSNSCSAEVRTQHLARSGLINLYFTSAGAHALYPNAVKNYQQTIPVPIYPSMSDKESKTISCAPESFL